MNKIGPYTLSTFLSKLPDTKSRFTINRKGSIKNIDIDKADRSSFLNICYSGNCVTGKGLYIDSVGVSYERAFVDGRREGKGLWIFNNGNSYQGDFMNNVFHGEGTYFYAESDYYKGGFQSGLKEGYGIMFIKKNNTIQKGYWKDGWLIEPDK